MSVLHLHRMLNIHPRTPMNPTYHQQGSWLCCTSGFESLIQYMLCLHSPVEDCHMFCSDAFDHRCRFCYNCPSCSMGPSSHELDRVHCCRNQCGCHFPHIAVPHAGGQDLHRYVSFALYHLRKKHYMPPNLPRMTTCHPQGSSSHCTLVSVCQVLHTMDLQMRVEGCCRVLA